MILFENMNIKILVIIIRCYFSGEQKIAGFAGEKCDASASWRER